MFPVLHLCIAIFSSSLPTDAYMKNSPCKNCTEEEVACFDGVCLLLCVNATPSGECLQCRGSRFYGPQCKNVCPDNCLNSTCHLISSRVVCTEGCVLRKMGDSCEADCPSGCTQCSRYDAKCHGHCEDHLYGSQCDKVCPSTCLNSHCQLKNSLVVCNECNSGYRGRICNESCHTNCESECDRDTGECGKCKTGFTGRICNETCSTLCRDSCDRDTGECINCKSGYRDKHCNRTCPSNCRGGCDKVTGECSSCKTGYSGQYCDNHDQGINFGLPAFILVLVAVLIIAVIAVVRYRNRKRLQPQNQTCIERKDTPASAYSDGSQYWASKYCEIDDKDLEQIPFLKATAGVERDNHASLEPASGHHQNSFNTRSIPSEEDNPLHNHLYGSGIESDHRSDPETSLPCSDATIYHKREENQLTDIDKVNENKNECSVTGLLISCVNNPDVSKAYVKYITTENTDNF